MFFQRVFDKSLAQASYVIGCQASGETMVVDPQRDIDVYLTIAEENNLTITHITETHIHADFLSGSRELVAATGGELYLSDEGGKDWQYDFQHIGLKHGDKINVGYLSLEVLHTPGHTPESISFLLTDQPATDAPIMLFTGDFVFVGDIGRPDLLEKTAGLIGTQEKGAQQMYDSIQRFTKLPEYVQVWPAHSAGSACGKALGAVPSSTIGYEKIRNWAFKYANNKKGFVNKLLDGQPEPPKYFAVMKHLNKVNRPLLVEVPQHPKLTKEQFIKAYNNGLKIIDTRSKEAFAKGHIPNSIHIEGGNSFSTWMGWLLNYQEQFILIANDNQIEDLSRKLMRIGMDNVYGYISNLNETNLTLQKADIISIDEFKAHLNKDHVQIVDVRRESEFKSGHIEGAEHIFLGTLPENIDKIENDKEVVIHCQSGMRSSTAYSLLKRKGIKNVKNFSGSMEQWIREGNKTTSS